MSTNTDLETPQTRRNARLWQPTIDKLLAWWTDPPDCEDEDYVPPLRTVLAQAIHAAQQFHDEDLAPPHRVGLDANGGIIFERRSGSECLKYHFWDDGTVEFIVMDGHKIISREKY